MQRMEVFFSGKYALKYAESPASSGDVELNGQGRHYSVANQFAIP